MDAQGLKKGKIGASTINKKIATTGTPICGVQAAATLIIAEPVTAADTITIGTRVYTFRATAQATVAYAIDLGSGEAETKLNIVKTILGTDGRTPRNEQVYCAAAFAGDNLVFTSRTAGVAGNAIACTETLTHVSNVWDAAVFGTTTAGVDGTVGEAGDLLVDDTYLYVCYKTGNVGGNWRRMALGNAY
jgi:hypothetical protein